MQESKLMALKQTEDQVKQMRDDHSSQTRVRPNSVRSKLANRVVGGKSSKERMGMQHGGSHNFLSDQDIKAALGLVDESWERQEYRLSQFLQRNYNIANGIPTALEVDEEDFERPDSASSLSKIVERVKFESTPTTEGVFELGTVEEDEQDDEPTPLEKELEMRFDENQGTSEDLSRYSSERSAENQDLGKGGWSHTKNQRFSGTGEHRNQRYSESSAYSESAYSYMSSRT